jgi:soluble calcium-activated nucleotidase 1
MKQLSVSSYRNQLLLVGAVAFLFVMYIALGSAPDAGGPITDHLRGQRLTSIQPRTEFLIVSDLDKRSAIPGLKKPRWKAVLRKGVLNFDAKAETYSVEWLYDVDLSSGHGEEGRGMELSELIMWNKRLYTMDDRSGIVYEILDYRTEDARVVPRFILMEGDGNTEKGLKGEWGTVKDGNMIISSFGKEYANSDGTIRNKNNNWVAEITPQGRITYLNWSHVFDGLRKATGYEFPAYILHEAAVWSDLRKQWVFLPRRMCLTPYNEAEDEKMGANSIFVMSDKFELVSSVKVGKITPERGFSTAKFIPGSGDNVMLALKSAEYSETDTQTTFISVVTLDGKELMPETEVPGLMKFEGLEFI